MPSSIATLRRDRTKASERMDALTAASRGRSMTDEEQREFDSASARVDDLDNQIAEREADLERNQASSVQRADAAQIARLCTEAGMPAMAAGLLSEGASVEAAEQRIAAAKETSQIVALARRLDASLPEDFGAKMLAEGKSPTEVRTAIFDRVNANDEETVISSHQPQQQQTKIGAAASAASMERELKRAGLNKEA